MKEISAMETLFPVSTLMESNTRRYHCRDHLKFNVTISLKITVFINNKVFFCMQLYNYNNNGKQNLA